MEKITKIILILIFLNISVFANTNNDSTFIKEYTYNASDDDSKNSSRKKAIAQLKALLSEEVGTHIASNFEIIKNSARNGYNQKIKKNLKTISASFTKLTIINEKWNGETYYIKASVKIDKKKTEDLINKIINTKKQSTNIQTNRSKQADEIMYETIKNSLSIQDLQYFINNYPNSQYLKIVQLKLKKIIQKKDVWIDNETNLMWQNEKYLSKDEDKKYLDFESAKSYCQNLKLENYNDWNIPTEKELLSIANIKFINNLKGNEQKKWLFDNIHKRNTVIDQSLFNNTQNSFFIKQELIENMPPKTNYNKKVKEFLGTYWDGDVMFFWTNNIFNKTKKLPIFMTNINDMYDFEVTLIDFKYGYISSYISSFKISAKNYEGKYYIRCVRNID